MGKKKHSKKSRACKDVKSLHDFSVDQLVAMPKGKLTELMLNDENSNAFTYPYNVIIETHDFIDNYKKLQTGCLAKLMSDFAHSGLMNENTISLQKEAISIIKATAQTASFKRLDEYKAKASDMYQKLLRAEELMEIALNQSSMDVTRKNTLRMVMTDAKKRLQETFDFIVDSEVTSNE